VSHSSGHSCWRVLNDKNLAVIDEIAAEDYVELDPAPGQAPGREGLKAFLATVLFPAFPDQRWVTEEQVAEGDKVVSLFTTYGTHRSDFMGIPATGTSIAVKGGCHRPACRRQMEGQPHPDGQPQPPPAAGRAPAGTTKQQRHTTAPFLRQRQMGIAPISGGRVGEVLVRGPGEGPATWHGLPV
jgi:SnoaL-like polyketide cyclase